MVSDNDLYATLRGFVNRGYLTPAKIAENSKLSPEVVAEALEIAMSRYLAYKRDNPECYMLSPWGQHEVEYESLQKIAAYNLGDIQSSWE